MRIFLIFLLLAATIGLFQNCGGPFQPLVREVETIQPFEITLSINAPKNSSLYVRDQLSLNGTCIDGIDVEFSGDIEPAPSAPCTNSDFSATLQLTPTDGLKNVRVQQVDSMGNVVADSLTYTRDTTPPTLSLVTPANGARAATSVVIQGLCETGDPVKIIENSKIYELNCTNGMFATTLPLSSMDGDVHLELAQTDKAGNTSSLPLLIKKDTLNPQITVTEPSMNQKVQGVVNVRGSCEDQVTVSVSGDVESPASVLCTGSSYNLSVRFGGSNGPRDFTVSQTDLAGNTSTITRTVIYEKPTVISTLRITSPQAGSHYKGSFQLQGDCESGRSVSISGNVTSPSSASCVNGKFSANVTLSSPDGARQVLVSQVDSSGTNQMDARSFTRDTKAPEMTISSPVSNSYHKESVQLTGACENGLPVVITGSGISGKTLICGSGAYSTSVPFSSGDGSKALSVSQTDQAGNTTTKSRTFIKDTVAPTVAIASPQAGTSGNTGLTISGSCENNLPVLISGSGLSSVISASCTNGGFHQSITFSSGDGSKVIQVSQTDQAGNTGSYSRTFSRETPEPVLDGQLLYAQNCAVCHGALGSSTKKDRSVAQISGAITAIPQMNALTHLSSAQLNAIAQALAQDDDEQPSLNGVTDPQLTLGNRTYLESLYTELFVASSNTNADDAKIRNIASSLLRDQVGANGGPCLAYDSSCPSSQRATAPYAVGFANGNAMRKGYTTRACEEILEIDRAVTNVLSKAGLNQNSTVSANTAQALFQVFHPGQTATGEVLNSLVAVANASRAKGHSALDQWRFTVLPLCLSSTMDIL